MSSVDTRNVAASRDVAGAQVMENFGWDVLQRFGFERYRTEV